MGRGVSVKLQRPSGELEERLVDFIYQPIRDDEIMSMVYSLRVVMSLKR